MGSDVQGFINPHGYVGKGTWGKGRDQGIGTLTKPLPSMQVGGYPQLFGRVMTHHHCNYGKSELRVFPMPWHFPAQCFLLFTPSSLPPPLLFTHPPSPHAPPYIKDLFSQPHLIASEHDWAPQFPCTQESKLTASRRRQGSFSWGWYVATSRNYNIAAQPFLNRPGFNRSLWGCGPLLWSNTNICTQMNHQQQPCMVTTMATLGAWPCNCCCHVNWHVHYIRKVGHSDEAPPTSAHTWATSSCHVWWPQWQHQKLDLVTAIAMSIDMCITFMR